MKSGNVLTLLTSVLLGIAIAAETPGSGSDPASRLPRGDPTPRPAGPAWIDLLDEDHVSGWRANAQQTTFFETEDGMLHVLGTDSGAYVGYMPERLRDFALHVEFRLAKAANSGIILAGRTADTRLQRHGDPVAGRRRAGAHQDILRRAI